MPKIQITKSKRNDITNVQEAAIKCNQCGLEHEIKTTPRTWELLTRGKESMLPMATEFSDIISLLRTGLCPVCTAMNEAAVREVIPETYKESENDENDKENVVKDKKVGITAAGERFLLFSDGYANFLDLNGKTATTLSSEDMEELKEALQRREREQK